MASASATARAVAAVTTARLPSMLRRRDVDQRVAERPGVMPAAFALCVRMAGREVLVVELLHRKRRGEESGARGALSDPQVDGAVDGELDDVVGREAQALLVVLVDGDAVGVDLHGEAGQRAGVFHLAHAEDG